ATLAEAGYPVISAKQITHRPGKQIALYEIVSFPTLFDLLKEEEDELLAGKIESQNSQKLLEAQEEMDRSVFRIYERTIKHISADKHASAPIHQLFHHRLSETGRLGLFYRNKEIQDDDGTVLAFDELARMRWQINGVTYKDSLADIIARAKELLRP